MKTYPSNEGWITATLMNIRPIERNTVIRMLGGGKQLEVAVYKVFKKSIRVTFRLAQKPKIIESPEDIQL